MITNGYQSFAVFTYRCGSLQWSGDAVIGFKVNDQLYDIHELSGNSANAIACLNSPRTIWSNVVYQLRKLMIIMCIKCPIMFCTFIFCSDLRELPFLSPDGSGTMLPSNTEDSISTSIPIPGGFPFGNSNQTTIYVRPHHTAELCWLSL